MKAAVGTDAGLETSAAFPNEIRSIDWLITTPLLLKFPALLGFGKGSNGLITRLITADIIMIVTGYLCETSINRADAATATGQVMFGIAVPAWLRIL
jgi:hypothetical protein